MFCDGLVDAVLTFGPGDLVVIPVALVVGPKASGNPIALVCVVGPKAAGENKCPASHSKTRSAPGWVCYVLVLFFF
jgi:hypothetical protein